MIRRPVDLPKANTGAFGISRQICFFSKVGLSDLCPQPTFTQGKNSKHYPGIELSTFGVAFGYANHYTIQVARRHTTEGYFYNYTTKNEAARKTEIQVGGWSDQR
jgi:hypothetical protein